MKVAISKSCYIKRNKICLVKNPLCTNSLICYIVTHRCVRCSSAFPGPLLQRSSCCTAGRGRCWGSGGVRCHSPPLPSLAPSVAHCSSTSDGLAGSSRSETRFHMPCRGRCPLKRDRKEQRGLDIRIQTVISYLCIQIKIKSLHTYSFYTSTALTLKACVKRVFHQILSCCILLCCYHWVCALSQGQTRTLDHLLTEASLLS